MKTWLIELADATQQHEGAIRVDGGALTLMSQRGIIAAYGQGAWKSAELIDFQPKDRQPKPAKPQPTAEDIAVAVSREVAKEVGKITKPADLPNPAPVEPKK
jgi:hypothetical protein